MTNAVVEVTGAYLNVVGLNDPVALDSPMGRFFLGFGLAFTIWLSAACIRIVRRGLFSSHRSEGGE